MSIESWYKNPHRLREWIDKRSKASALKHGHVSRQRKMAMNMTVFSASRVGIWTIFMIMILLHWCGINGGPIHWVTTVSGEVIFVTFISFYCNAATDFASLMASMAALFSADSHGAVMASQQMMTQDYTAIEGDIARLALLSPGPEATALAAQIRSHLTGKAVSDLEEPPCKST